MNVFVFVLVTLDNLQTLLSTVSVSVGTNWNSTDKNDSIRGTGSWNVDIINTQIITKQKSFHLHCNGMEVDIK